MPNLAEVCRGDSLWAFSVTNMTIKVQCDPIDMNMLLGIPGIRYHPARFPAAFLKLKSCSVNIFRSGVAVFLGLRVWNDIYECVCDFEELMFGVTVVRSQPLLCNVAASLKPMRQLKLNLAVLAGQLAASDGIANVVYEPELHNGMKVRFSEIDGCIILHTSGKGIITGAKCTETFDQMLDLLSSPVAVFMS